MTKNAKRLLSLLNAMDVRKLGSDFIRLHRFEQFLERWAFTIHQHTCTIDFRCQPAEDHNRYHKNGQGRPDLPGWRNACPNPYQNRRW